MNQVETITLKDNTNRNDPNSQKVQNNEPNIQIANMPLETNGILMNFHANPTIDVTLPFDVSRELATYTKIFVSKEVDIFRIFHFTESFVEDYKVYGELPCGDKQILFTVRKHITPKCTSCKNCCSQCCNKCCEKKKGCCRVVVRVLYAHFVVLVNMYVMILLDFNWIIKEIIIFFITKHLFMNKDATASVLNVMVVRVVLVLNVHVVVVNFFVLIFVVTPVPQIL